MLTLVAAVDEGVVVLGAAGVEGVSVDAAATVVEASYQQAFHWPTAGSPKVELLQFTEFVNVSTTADASTPYLTLRVPLKEHVSPSPAHCVQVGVVLALAAVAPVPVPVSAPGSEAEPPPHAVSAAHRIEAATIAAL